MNTALHPSPIFGPITSRRLGNSLGINLLPADGKICTFDCIYCECGYNKDRHPKLPFPKREEVAKALENKLLELVATKFNLDVMTFSGNGEPTAHPDFAHIIDDTIALRNQYFPQAKVSVLSNATFIHKPEIRRALLKVDNNILKLDTFDNEYIQLVDRPSRLSFNTNYLLRYLKAFQGKLIIQTIFMKGETESGQSVDNTSERFIMPWLEALKAIAPKQVMIYTIERNTPDPYLEKASPQQLNSIRDRVEAIGIACTASY